MKHVRENSKISFKGQDFFVGIDVHGKSWKVTIRNNHMELKTYSMEVSPEQLHRYLSRNYPDGNYHAVYEAGFCGFWIQRRLTQLGITTIIANPADVPTTNKEKDQKRDPIDSRKLARELENKSLKGIYVPTERQQAFRSVARIYMQKANQRTRIKQKIKSFLYFNGIEIPRVDQISHWSGPFISWLKSIEFSQKGDKYYLQRLIDGLEQCRKECVEILRHMKTMVQDNKIIFCLRTIPVIGFIISFIIYAELMDMRRFRNTDRVASYIGLVPSVDSSGEYEKVRGLTFRHNKYLRKLLIESAWVARRK